MTPTRELCMQIGKECKKFTKSLNLRAVCVYGGTGISEQIAELKRGAEIIVCTPGRMIDLLAANSGMLCMSKQRDCENKNKNKDDSYCKQMMLKRKGLTYA